MKYVFDLNAYVAHVKKNFSGKLTPSMLAYLQNCKSDEDYSELFLFKLQGKTEAEAKQMGNYFTSIHWLTPEDSHVYVSLTKFKKMAKKWVENGGTL